MANSSSPVSWYDLPAPDWEHLFFPQRDYEYFRELLPEPVLSNLANPVTAAWMADAAMLAYGRSGSELMPAARFDSFFDRAGLTCQKIGDWSDPARGTQAFFACNAKVGVLSFRGTEKNDWTDSLTDANVVLVR